MSPLRNTDGQPSRGRHIARVASAIGIAALGGTLAACADAPSSPLAPASAPSLTVTSSSDVNMQLEREKRRIAAAQQASQRTYDSLTVVWAQLNETYPNGNPELLYCDPLQYVATTKIVGPAGGTLDFGPHKLRIPAGALLQPTVITAEAPTTLQVRAVFSPHGLQFAVPATLSLSYKHCNRPTTFREEMGYVNNAGTILERPLSTDRTNDAIVDGVIHHFSGYNVVFGRTPPPPSGGR